jgi:hypothetical protein
VDINGHAPIPLARKIVFHLGIFSAVFRVPNFWGHFEALNDVFWGFGAQVKFMYGTGASLHIIQPASQPHQAHAFKAEERRSPHLKLELNLIKCFRLLSHEVVPLSRHRVDRP